MATSKAVDPRVATQQIKHLASHIQKHHNPSHVIHDAFSIYHQVHGRKHILTINAILTLCFKCKYPEKVLSIWNDIEHVHQSIIDPQSSITYSVLFKCCSNSDDIPIDKCFQVLQWIKSSDYSLKIHGVYISKLLTKCMKQSPNIESLRTIHSFIDSYFIGKMDIFIQTQLINAYGDLGDWERAMAVFHSIAPSEYNEYCISSMMKVYCNHSLHKPALELYDSSRCMFGVFQLNAVCHIMALRCCKALDSLEKGFQIINGFKSFNGSQPSKPSQDIALQNAMIDFYGHFGLTDRAERLFDEMQYKDAFTIGAMMTLYLYNHHDPGTRCLEMYDTFRGIIRSDDICKVLALRACVILGDSESFKKGIQIHHEAVQLSRVSLDMDVAKQLICFYGHFHDIPAAMNVFEEIPDEHKGVMHLGAIMKVLIENGHSKQAMAIYDKYCTVNRSNNTIKMYAIKACNHLLGVDYANSLERGREIIDTVDLRVTQHLQLLTAMIDFYGHSSILDIDNAVRVFQSIADHGDDVVDILPITAMMNAFAGNERYTECLQLFHDIESKYGLTPNVSCYKIIFPVCAAAGWVTVGTALHDALSEDVESQWIATETDVVMALIAMYGKFGIMERCQGIFGQIREEHPERYCTEIGIWNAMIEAVATNGDMDGVKQLMNTMQMETDLGPDCQSFVLWITACSHFGDLELAADIWKHRIGREEVMFDRYVITSLVDALARSGFVIKAFEIIIRYEKYSKQKYHESMWTALLTGCKSHQQTLLGKWFYEKYFDRFKQHKSRLQVTK